MRYLQKPILELLQKKMVLLMGPRQVGKTTFSKDLSSDFAYYNYDLKKDLQVFLHQNWDRSKNLIIFDELHKMKKWKLWLKGLHDEGLTKKQSILVTGSARLDIAKKMGDSLAGRFFSMRLHPLDLKELKMMQVKADSTVTQYKKLLNFSGFPEPFFEGTERFYGMWRKTHSDLIIRQDMPSLETVKDIDGIELLIELLATRVGSLISFNSLSEDLGRDDKTIKRWLEILERMYVVFRVSPFSKNISRSIKKAGKYYFYDLARVEGDEGQKLENLVALALKKEIEYQEDCNGTLGKLQFLQTKDKREIDFLVTQRNKNPRLFEVKLSDAQVSKNFDVFTSSIKNAEQIQIVKNLDREYQSSNGTKVLSALDYLENFNFN